MERNIRNVAWILICILMVLVLIQFDTLALANMMQYGLLYRGLVAFLGILMVVKALLHFGDLYVAVVVEA